MAISRSLMERQLRAGGGLMTLEEPRQGYFLGKIVKKAKRAVKKIGKSPIGKAALLGAGAMYAGGLGPFAAGGRFASIPGAGFGGGILTGLKSGDGFLGQIGNVFRVGGDAKNKFSALRLLGGGLGAAAIAAPFLMGGDEEEEEPDIPFTQTPDSIASIVNMARNQDPSLRFLPKPKFVDNFYAADGGLADIPREGYAEGGIMNLGGMEKDYRTGGFVDLGAEERADDVPARLSKNEFVFTADAVRNAGGGDIDKGAEVMQNMMDNLEAGGNISEESQGMENPAQAMFDQAQMLEGRLA